MRNSAPIKIQAVAVKGPGERGVGFEPTGIGHLGKREAKFGDGWIGFPKTLRATKVRQAGIDTNARTGGDEKCVGVANGLSGACEDGLKRIYCHPATLFVCCSINVSGAVQANTPATTCPSRTQIVSPPPAGRRFGILKSSDSNVSVRQSVFNTIRSMELAANGSMALVNR